MLILGIVDFGRAFNHWIDSTHLANVAARYAPSTRTRAQRLATLQRHMELQASIQGCARQHPADAGDVCVSFPAGTSNVGDPVKVEVKSTWSWLEYLVGQAGLAPSSVIRGSATMRLEAKPTNYSAGCA